MTSEPDGGMVVPQNLALVVVPLAATTGGEIGTAALVAGDNDTNDRPELAELSSLLNNGGGRGGGTATAETAALIGVGAPPPNNLGSGGDVISLCCSLSDCKEINRCSLFNHSDFFFIPRHSKTLKFVGGRQSSPCSTTSSDLASLSTHN